MALVSNRSIPAVGTRALIVGVFFMPDRTKVEELLKITESTYTLLRIEYRRLPMSRTEGWSDCYFGEMRLSSRPSGTQIETTIASLAFAKSSVSPGSAPINARLSGAETESRPAAGSASS